MKSIFELTSTSIKEARMPANTVEHLHYICIPTGILPLMNYHSCIIKSQCSEKDSSFKSSDRLLVALDS